MSAAIDNAVGARIWAEAQQWIGTPFRWQGRIKGVGCDCKGLLAGVAAACGRSEAGSVEALAGDYREGRFAPARLRAGLDRLFEPVAVPVLGGPILLIMAGAAQHLAIAGPVAPDGRVLRMIHAWPGGVGRVAECDGALPHRIARAYCWKVGGAG